jgi:hypothetical protein
MPPIDLPKGLIGDTNSMFASIIWGAIGSGFFIFGSKQKSMVPLFGGIALVAGSYFFANSALVMSLFSIAVIAAIYFLKGRF